MYEENSFANGAFPMVAVTQATEDHNLNFKNVLGAMKLSLKGLCVVKSIKVEGADGEKLSGAATVTAYANNPTPSIKMTGSDDVCKSVTLDCGEGVQLNETEVTNFFIALPPVLFEKGFTVTVTDVEKNEYTITATDDNTILRSSILVMPEVAIEQKEVEDSEGGSGDSDESGNSYDYIDEYGINHGPGVEIDGVVWAPVNCGYHATDYKWGKLYQWCRKYGQGYDGDATVPVLIEAPVSEVDGNHKNNADKFYYGMDDWVDPHNAKLWNNGSESSPVKTDADPCPDGWRVPTCAELEELCQNYSSWTTNASDQPGYWFSGPSSYSQEAAQVFFPAAGYRDYYDGLAYARGDYGTYWSSSPYYGGAYTLGFGNGDAYMSHRGFRAYGYSVRCVQD